MGITKTPYRPISNAVLQANNSLMLSYRNVDAREYKK